MSKPSRRTYGINKDAQNALRDQLNKANERITKLENWLKESNALRDEWKVQAKKAMANCAKLERLVKCLE